MNRHQILLLITLAISALSVGFNLSVLAELNHHTERAPFAQRHHCHP